ncbi:MAG: aldehyde dehydrogenase family protein [Myxococcota bacterium]|nr:aldehyde dehydrogenase family protein [Myxococcota bacterium]
MSSAQIKESNPIIQNGAIQGLSPRTGTPMQPVTTTSPQDLNEIVARARQAQHTWKNLHVRERAKKIKALYQVFLKKGPEFAAIMHEEQGKSFAESYSGEILASAELFKYWSAQAPKLLQSEQQKLDPIQFPRKQGRLELSPKGVIGLITPWNYPLSIPLRTIVPALVAGNAVIFKPSEYAARIGSAITDVFGELGLEHLVSTVQGDGQLGAHMVNSNLDHIVFTGSVQTGKIIAQECAKNLLSYSLELGGKDAAIVLADANLDRAVEGIVWGAFANAGQNCASVERVYVVKEHAETFITKVVERSQKIVLGTDDKSIYDIGPFVREQELLQTEYQLKDALNKGAKILHGGKRHQDTLFFEPTVLRNVDQSMLVMSEETFGPVLPIQIVSNVNEAISETNASRYGLTTSIWSQNIQTAENLAKEIESGIVTINNHSFTAALPQAPWHGKRHSGSGVTNSRFALYDMVEPHYILVDKAKAPELWWFPHNTAMQNIVESLAAFFSGAAGRMSALLKVIQNFPKRWKI